MHLSAGGPLKHMTNTHNKTLTRNILVENTKILHQNHDVNRLELLEALVVYKNKPTINKQATGISRTLELFGIAQNQQRDV